MRLVIRAACLTAPRVGPIVARAGVEDRVAREFAVIGLGQFGPGMALAPARAWFPAPLLKSARGCSCGTKQYLLRRCLKPYQLLQQAVLVLA